MASINRPVAKPLTGERAIVHLFVPNTRGSDSFHTPSLALVELPDGKMDYWDPEVMVFTDIKEDANGEAVSD